MASFHLEGEANQWWQWVQRVNKEEEKVISQEAFEGRFWPDLAQASMKTPMRLYHVFTKLVLYMIMILNALQIGLWGLRKH